MNKKQLQQLKKMAQDEAKKQIEKKKAEFKDVCPRCRVNRLPEPKVRYCSLSRRDNNTYICDECGTEEALVDAGYISRTAEIEERERRIPLGE